MPLNKKIDRSKKAKPVGYRFKGNHKELGKMYYKRPENELTARQFKNYKKKGLVVYEPRASKGDFNQRDRFAKGGVIATWWASLKETLMQPVTFKDIFGGK